MEVKIVYFGTNVFSEYMKKITKAVYLDFKFFCMKINSFFFLFWMSEAERTRVREKKKEKMRERLTKFLFTGLLPKCLQWQARAGPGQSWELKLNPGLRSRWQELSK